MFSGPKIVGTQLAPVVKQHTTTHSVGVTASVTHFWVVFWCSCRAGASFWGRAGRWRAGRSSRAPAAPGEWSPCQTAPDRWPSSATATRQTTRAIRMENPVTAADSSPRSSKPSARCYLWQRYRIVSWMIRHFCYIIMHISNGKLVFLFVQGSGRSSSKIHLGHRSKGCHRHIPYRLMSAIYHRCYLSIECAAVVYVGNVRPATSADILTLARLPCFANFTRTGRGGWCDPPPLGVSKRSVVELRGKDQQIALAEYSRLVVLFLVLKQYLTQLWQVKGHIFENSMIFHYRNLNKLHVLSSTV